MSTPPCNETASAGRLVIRVKLTPQAPPPPARLPVNKNVLWLILASAAVLLAWWGIGFLKSDPPPETVMKAAAVEPPPTPVAETAVAGDAATNATPSAPDVVQQPEAPPSPINQVVPDVPKSALDTIRGTIRVSMRLTFDKQGNVVDVAAVERGPSRYFERLAREASKKWTFTPANVEEKRTMLVRFSFTRFGASAAADPPA